MMKKVIRLLALLLLCLTACGKDPQGVTHDITLNTTYNITSELTQRYEATDLRWQEGLFRAMIAPSAGSYTVEAGLHATTGHLTVAYTDDGGGQFWLECQTLNETQSAMAKDRNIPLGVWLTNEDTPEYRAELLLLDDHGQMYAVYLCSSTMPEDVLLRSARQVHVWLPGAAEAITVSCTDEPAIPPQSTTPPWRQSGDLCPDTEDHVMRLRVDTACCDLASNGSWRLQRLEGGRWYDMDQTGSGLNCDGSSVWGMVELPLPAGNYRLMLAASSETGNFTEIPYHFQSAG